MTRSLIICMALFLGAFSAFSENLPIYTNLTPPHTTKIDFIDVCFRDSQNGFMISKDGLLFRTTDGGENWYVQERLQNDFLGRIYLKTEDTIFISGRHNIFKSENGGESWFSTQKLPMQDPAGNEYPALFDMHFISPNIGFAFGIRVIWKTEDGGKTWKEVMLSYDFILGFIQSIHFTDNLNGLAFAHKMVFKTSDGGETWNKITTDLEIGEAFFFNDLHGLATETMKSQILETFDGGNSWEKVQNIQGTAMNYQFFGNKEAGVALFANSYFAQTVDSGKTWQEILIPNQYGSYLKSMDFYDENHGFIVGDKGVILQTTDGGLTWERKPWGFPQGFKRLFFQDSLNGTVIAGDGKILHTTDGGAQWDVIDLGQLKEPDNITFPTRDTGYMTVNYQETNTDYYSYLYYTHNGGENWDKSDKISYRNQVEGIDFLHFPTADTGYAGVNFWGEMYATFDGGQTVKKKDNYNVGFPNNRKLTTGSFPDTRHGFVFGSEGTFSYTKDAGSTWTRKDIDGKPDISVCHFYDTLTGLAMYKSIYRTEDGGMTWNLVLDNIVATRYYEISETSGYVKLYSNDDSVYYTADKGKTWEIQHKGAISWNEIYFVNPYLAYCTKQTTDSVGIYRVDFPRPEPQPFDTQRVVLQPGWNFFSTYISLNSASIEAFTEGTSIDIIKNTHQFWHTDRNEPVNRLTEITAGEGYAIHCQSAEELVLVGYAMEPSMVNSSKGWSLVGCSYAQPKGFEEIVPAISKAVSNNGYWKPNDNSSTIDSLEPGKAYYILVE